MKDEVLGLVRNVGDPTNGLNLMREYLQAFVLRSLHECEAFTTMAFVGGTALRFLENLPRFSEDLDFSLIKEDRYDPKRWLGKVRRDLALAGYDCQVTLNSKKVVNTSWIRLSGLLAEAGLSNRVEQKLSIKLEIDTRPPKGADVVRTVLTRHLTFALRHYEISSLMAGKIRALITRPYPKGRDWFDLVWYCSHRPPIEPKTDLLQNALDQTQGKGHYDARQWRELVRQRLENIDVNKLKRDVSPFLERPADRDLLSYENLKAVLSG